jgi:hypothetical protein
MDPRADRQVAEIDILARSCYKSGMSARLRVHFSTPGSNFYALSCSGAIFGVNDAPQLQCSTC